MLTRTVVGLGIGALFLLLALNGFWSALFIVCLINAFCQHELVGLDPKLSRSRILLHMAVSTAVLCVCSLSLLDYIDCRWGLAVLGICAVLYAGRAVLHYEIADQPTQWLPVLGMLFISLPLACVPSIAAWPGGFPFLLLLAGSSWGADTGAIFAGKLMGKTPLAPRISPKKTVEGLIGGMLSAGAVWAVAPLLFHAPYKLLPELLAASPVLLCLALFVLGALSALPGVAGDLTFSLFKRQAGVKDYSHLLPGHGGMLDRVDSFLFAAPVVYLLCLCIPAG